MSRGVTQPGPMRRSPTGRRADFLDRADDEADLRAPRHPGPFERGAASGARIQRLAASAL